MAQLQHEPNLYQTLRTYRYKAFESVEIQELSRLPSYYHQRFRYGAVICISERLSDVAELGGSIPKAHDNVTLLHIKQGRKVLPQKAVSVLATGAVNGHSVI